MTDYETTYVIGHKNPDTDSICSAICYANLKRKVDGKDYEPARAGQINQETRFVLDYFDLEAPRLIENITTQVKDIEIRKTEGVCKNLSIKLAWNMMQEHDIYTIPVVSQGAVLEGLITVGDIAKSYMNVYDSDILSKANTQYSNIIDTLKGTTVIGDHDQYFAHGKVLIAAANPDMMESFIAKGDLVILGNRYESQLCAIEMEAACIIVCEGAPVSLTIRKLAQARGCNIISTPYDAFTVARLINQSIPVEFFMRTEHLIAFEDTDYIDEVKDVMASKRHRDFPVIDEDGKYMGMISRRNLLGAKGKPVILVDHNEKNQTVEGIEHAEIKEIIDHHRIGAVETISPVFFRNQPLGCTSTIIYQMYREEGIEIDQLTAGLLCSAIISDTLLFRSPTCTEVDRKAALELAGIAGIDPEEFAEDMFAAGSNLKGKSIEEIFYQDFKRFTAGSISFGVGQLIAANRSELEALQEDMVPFMEKALAHHGMDMMFFMLTNILSETTGLICAGSGAKQLILDVFSGEYDEEYKSDHVIRLPGMVSRKKQLVPKIIMALGE